MPEDHFGERVAARFDERHPHIFDPAVVDPIVDVLAELAGDGAALELGVGTGRIALPLAGRGVSLVGIDLAQNMLNKLIENARGAAPFPLVQADATRVPFHDGSFDGAIVSWVLHLIPEWRTVLGELGRVVRPGGILLVDVGREDQSITTELTWRFRDLAEVTDWPRGAKSYEEVDDVLVSLGARPRDLESVHEVLHMPLEDHISRLERAIYSVTWGVDVKIRRRVADELRTWAEEKYGSITEPMAIETPHVWRAYDL